MADAVQMLVKGYDEDMVNCLFAYPKTKPHVEKTVLRALNDELENLCSKNTNSVLRNTKPKELKNLTLHVINNELKTKSPLFHKVFQTMCISKGAISHHRSGTALTSNSHIVKLISPATVILKARSKDMCAWASKNALALQYGGCSNMVITSI